jgi:hypothetical protein
MREKEAERRMSRDEWRKTRKEGRVKKDEKEEDIRVRRDG